jgi:phosphinothricin acetyltransferase
VTPNELRTRLATPADAPAIATIYNEGIADRIATFETESRTPEQLFTQLVDKGDRFPTVVVERDGQVIAWASAGPYRNRPAYAGVAEHSVYVARAARGTGAGRAALEAFCRAYAERGFWKIVSRIFPENVASLALHEHCGFRVVGVYRRHGKLEGQWRDCVIVERLLERPGPIPLR